MALWLCAKFRVCSGLQHDGAHLRSGHNVTVDVTNAGAKCVPHRRTVTEPQHFPDVTKQAALQSSYANTQ